MTQERDARILDHLDEIKYNVSETQGLVSRLVQARAIATLGLSRTYSAKEREYWSKVYEIIHSAMLEVIYLDKELTQ